jgi:hypothetical protein
MHASRLHLDLPGRVEASASFAVARDVEGRESDEVSIGESSIELLIGRVEREGELEIVSSQNRFPGSVLNPLHAIDLVQQGPS